MIFLYIVLPILSLFLILYLFLILPSDGRKAKAFEGKYIAHRGLHGDGAVENTLEAFKRSVDKGYGVELDVQLSSDKIPVVAHDSDLKRVFGIDKKVNSLSAAELKEIGVPTLEDVLTVLGGKVPLIAEIKGDDLNTEVCERAAELLDNYKGLYCIESFNPFLVRWFKKNRKNVVRGQLSTAFSKKRDKNIKFIHTLSRHMLLNFLSRPHFVAYEHKYFGFSVRLCKLFGAHMVCWTTKSEEDQKRASKHYSTFIFENYEP